MRSPPMSEVHARRDGHREGMSDSTAPSATLRDEERQVAQERSALGVHVVHEAIRLEGEEELKRPTSALAWSGVAAGLSMGFSLVVEALLRSRLPDAPWLPLVSKLGYTFGFIVVILGRQQLFTENTLTVVLPLLERRDAGTLVAVTRVWAVVLASNVVGALLFAWLIGVGDLFPPEMRRAFADMGREAVRASFGTQVLLGIFGGWLIALTVWLLPAAANARVFVIVIVTYVVGLGHFAHAVAGSVDALYLVTHGELSAAAYLSRFLVPVFLGNAIGGVSLVAALNHAQVAPGRDRAHA